MSLVKADNKPHKTFMYATHAHLDIVTTLTFVWSYQWCLLKTKELI